MEHIRFKYVNPNTFYYKSKRYGKLIIIFRSFLWDGSTGVIDLNYIASMVHDALYRFQDKHFEGITRKIADLIYMDILLEYGLNKKWAKIRYIGVRLFGCIIWHINKKKIKDDYIGVIKSSFLPHLGKYYEIPTIYTSELIKKELC